MLPTIVSLLFFSSRRRHTRSKRDWSSDVCSSDLTRKRRVKPRPARDRGSGGGPSDLAIRVGYGARHRASARMGREPMRRAPRGRRINRKPRKRLRWIIPVIVLVAVVGVAGFGVRKAADWINGPDDYQGQGSGSVVVQIPEGANGQQIADVLHEADVVKSSEAFYQLSLNDERAQEIQPGFYQLREHMSAQWALRELSDDANRVEGNVVV